MTGLAPVGLCLGGTAGARTAFNFPEGLQRRIFGLPAVFDPVVAAMAVFDDKAAAAAVFDAAAVITIKSE